MKFASVIAALVVASAVAAEACDTPVSVCPQSRPGSFALIAAGRPSAVLVDSGANSAVRYVAQNFVEDLERVSGRKPALLEDASKAKGAVVVIGVLGQSPIIDGLVRANRIAARDIEGQWEAFRQIVVEKPFPGVARALVIVGADRRGAVFGTYDISEKMGVSPLTWFADVPVRRKANLYITAGERRDQPKVKYRGLFINDEAPAFSTWTEKKFGGANHKAYAHIFELSLRLKGNYLWPAMWPPRAFNDDDRENMVLADAMGIVMATSHHEPLTRAHDEWRRATEKGQGGKWDYTTNADNLRKFWRGGVERMMSKGDGKGYESVLTVGMRGDGDEPMSEGTATKLLETIVADQRQIIAEVTGKPADQTPQSWALYKEVQDYYDHGMTVPDDVTLLFSDDNWGQIRRLPTKDVARSGGYGVYYHFDYVGGPRNYKWLNTNQIEKTWQQMDLAYQRGARTIWVVNVGDIKPMEYPIQFFLKQAWNPEAMTLEALKAYPRQWAQDTFGPANAAAIADLVTTYAKLAARRKPELIDATSFPLGDSAGKTLDGGEFGLMVARWQHLEAAARAVKAKLPRKQHDAYFQLVQHPIAALSNLYQLYYAVAWNRRLAEANDPRANLFADKAEAAFRRDQTLSDQYHALNGGKWDGMMLQTHIGYTTWQQPEKNIMPEVKRVGGKAGPIAFARPAPVPGDVIAIEAPHYTRAVSGKDLTWSVIPNLGRTVGAVTALPQGRDSTSKEDGVRLEYDVSVRRAGTLNAQLYLVPTIDTRGAGGIRIGVSLDDGPMQTLKYNLIPVPGEAKSQDEREWQAAVIANVHSVGASFADVTAGRHTVKVWRLDDNAVLQKLVLATGPVPPSYLGPEAARR